jgi:phage/plasmid-like protein (TIGR03299 family)
VVHRGFVPVQNRDAARLFDGIFGRGQRVYHTGGYLGNGEAIWLLARLNHTLVVGRDDVIEPYALMANSHDGSLAFHMRLTTVRVVCQNTLALAMHEKVGQHWRRAHQGSFAGHGRAASEFFEAATHELHALGQIFSDLAARRCRDTVFQDILVRLWPDPKKPRNADRNPRLLRTWERRVLETHAARTAVAQLRTAGKGMALASSAGTL